MNSQNVCILFSHYRTAVKNLQKTCVANTCLNRGQMTIKLRKLRKYKPPVEDPFYTGVGPRKKFDDMCKSLKARGFGKEWPSYQPPSDLEKQLHNLCKKVFGSQLSSNWTNQSLNDRVLKFKLLTEAIKLFGKDIPNTELHKMKEVKDVQEHFSVAVDGSYHYDALTRDKAKLPPNLQVLPEGPRFNAATDTFFDGKTAYPDRRRVLYTKAGEKLEKIIEWPHV